VFIFVFLTGIIGFSNFAQAQRGRCGNQTFCWDGDLYPPCYPLPTTLPPVSSTYSGGYGFSIASGSCGAQRCYYLFSCRCGPGLGGGICNSALDQSSSESCHSENSKSVEKD
jgi:hypothetical protein